LENNEEEKMKKIFIKYTAEVDDYEFDRICKKARVGKRDLHAMLRDIATTEGLIAIRKKIQEVR
tara:strand:+ start:297 stop:488 length:192 start_codon:yes stop_codon:yes gene_type:complete